MGLPIKEDNKKNILLVEPDYKSHFPSLALLKFSTYYKSKGYDVRYVKENTFDSGIFDKILITSLFTDEWKITIDTIMHYKEFFPNSEILVGGVYASLLPEHIFQYTGIKPIAGSLEEIDECAPDYTLLPLEKYKETSRLFTSKGCPRNCKFCGTKVIEKKQRIIKNWKKHFFPKGKYSIFHDNNILAHGDNHFFDVTKFLQNKKIRYMFDNGFDCRLFTKQHARLLKKTNISEIRFSFDSMEQDGYVQDAVKNCIDCGFHSKKIKVFILYNYEDDIENALYRAKEIFGLGAKAWAMRYKPLDWLYIDETFLSDSWNIEDLYYFNSYINRFGISNKYTYDEWKTKKLEKSKISTELKIEKYISQVKHNAEIKDDEESLFNDPNFIKFIIKGKDC